MNTISMYTQTTSLQTQLMQQKNTKTLKHQPDVFQLKTSPQSTQKSISFGGPIINRIVAIPWLLTGGKICKYCKKPLTKTRHGMHIDHVHPKSRGGPDTPSNKVATCAECNLGKGSRSLREFKKTDLRKRNLAGLALDGFVFAGVGAVDMACGFPLLREIVTGIAHLFM